MSPVAMCGMPKRSRSMFAWVPLPLPGAPYRRRFITCLSPSPHPLPDGERAADRLSFNEAAVLAHDQLRLQLFHRVQGNAHNDEDCGTRQIHLLMRAAGDLRRGYGEAHRDEGQEWGSRERDPIHDRGQEVPGGTSRTYARDEARGAFEVGGDVMYLERDRGVEIREPERERE